VTRLAEVLVLSAALGSLYALLGVSVTVVYQAARVPNVAVAAVGTVAAIFHWDLVTPGGRIGSGIDYWLALALALGLAAVLGLITDLLVRGLRERVLASLLLLLGWMVLLLATANAVWGNAAKFLPVAWSGPALSVGDFSVPRHQVATLAIAAVAGTVLAALLRRTRFGLALQAAAADPEAARMAGIDTTRLSRRAWVLGSVVGALAVILILPPFLSNPYETTLLLPFAFGAALLGGFRSLPLAVAGGLALGVVPSLLEPSDTIARIGGVRNLVAFLMIAGLLLKRPPAPSASPTTAGRWGSGTFSVTAPAWLGRTALVAVVLALAVVVPAASSNGSLLAWSRGISVFLVCASIVVVSGWAGQVSLAQVAFAGLGAYVVGDLTVRLGLPHVLAIPMAALSVLPFAVVVGLPALRSWDRLHLAVASLAFMMVASSLLWGPQADWFRGDRLRLSRPSWMEVLSGRPAASYYLMVLGLAAAVVWFALNLRSSRVGRAMAAVAQSDPAARSLGIDPARSRLSVFAFSAVVAALGGIVYAYSGGVLDPGRFAAFFSIQYLLYAVVGGTGSLLGTAVIVFAFEVAPNLSGGVTRTGPGTDALIVLGVLALVAVRFVPDGLAGLVRRAASPGVGDGR
jgi:branched-subunit amino acid ABC-type transport system permease component